MHRNVPHSMLSALLHSSTTIFIERLWRSLKYEFIHIQEFASVAELRKGLTEWFEAYNQERFHQALKYRTPDEVYQLDMAA